MTNLSATNRRVDLVHRIERALIGGGFEHGKTQQARTFPEYQRDVLEDKLIELLRELGAK